MDTLIQDVPETSSDERMHVLDETCWCKPTTDGEYLRHRPSANTPDYELPVHITRDGIYIGNQKIPGCIAEDSITVKPGGRNGINVLTCEFYIGAVTIDDPLDDDDQPSQQTASKLNTSYSKHGEALSTPANTPPSKHQQPHNGHAGT